MVAGSATFGHCELSNDLLSRSSTRSMGESASCCTLRRLVLKPRATGRAISRATPTAPGDLRQAARHGDQRAVLQVGRAGDELLVRPDREAANGSPGGHGTDGGLWTVPVGCANDLIALSAPTANGYKRTSSCRGRRRCGLLGGGYDWIRPRPVGAAATTSGACLLDRRARWRSRLSPTWPPPPGSICSSENASAVSGPTWTFPENLHVRWVCLDLQTIRPSRPPSRS